LPAFDKLESGPVPLFCWAFGTYGIPFLLVFRFLLFTFFYSDASPLGIFFVLSPLSVWATACVEEDPSSPFVSDCRIPPNHVLSPQMPGHLVLFFKNPHALTFFSLFVLLTAS